MSNFGNALSDKASLINPQFQGTPTAIIDGITELHSNYSYYLRIEAIDSSGKIVTCINYNTLTYEYNVANLLTSKPTVTQIRFCFKLKMGDTEADNVAITTNDVADLLIYKTLVS